jgi:hypothetical protein
MGQPCDLLLCPGLFERSGSQQSDLGLNARRAPLGSALTSIRKRRRIQGAYRIKNMRGPEHVVLGGKFDHDSQPWGNGKG